MRVPPTVTRHPMPVVPVAVVRFAEMKFKIRARNVMTEILSLKPVLMEKESALSVAPPARTSLEQPLSAVTALEMGPRNAMTETPLPRLVPMDKESVLFAAPLAKMSLEQCLIAVMALEMELRNVTMEIRGRPMVAPNLVVSPPASHSRRRLPNFL